MLHRILGTSLIGPWVEGSEIAIFGMGCFWGAERAFWSQRGVHCTSVGYAGGHTKNPTYNQVCTDRTGHAEVVRVTFDPTAIPYRALLKVFWESHNPTQGNRQGNDIGTAYRSLIMYNSECQRLLAEETKEKYQAELSKRGLPQITTEIVPYSKYYLAEDYHQQYLAGNPMGYCTMKGTGIVLS